MKKKDWTKKKCSQFIEKKKNKNQDTKLNQKQASKLFKTNQKEFH